MQACLVAKSARSKPSLRATSATERIMMVVEMGNSTNSAAKPKAPPTAPEVAAYILCSKVDAGFLGALSRLHSAASAELCRAATTAPLIFFATTAGSALTALSMGEPSSPDRRAVSEGDSSKATARLRSW